jgi:hypothetical protein
MKLNGRHRDIALQHRRTHANQRSKAIRQRLAKPAKRPTPTDFIRPGSRIAATAAMLFRSIQYAQGAANVPR